LSRTSQNFAKSKAWARILFLTEGLETPSSRYRVAQFIPHFEAAGIQCTVKYGYGRAYNQVHSRSWAPAYKLVCRAKRALATFSPKPFDLVFLQKTSLPMTALPEVARSLAGNRMIFDFDDSIYLSPGGAPGKARSRTFRDVIRASSLVIAGNGHLAEVGAAPDKTIVLPTVVDTDRYAPRLRRSAARVVVGWMGTASNFGSLRSALPGVLAAIESSPNAVLRIVSNAELPELRHHKQVDQVRWSAASEVEHLQSFDVGLMPLEDTQSSLGKCGFKMIQYMACGTAVVASDVGANREILGSTPAVLVKPGSDWQENLKSLLSTPELIDDMAARGREHVVASFSVRSMLPEYLAAFRRLLGLGV
jgi:glycosyltransferase involved in cell wall biosynthesis